MKRFKLLAPALGSALLAGCATPSYVSPVEVTRFSDTLIGAPLGTVTVRAAPENDPQSRIYGAFQAAVQQELAETGFQVAGSGAAYTATIDVEQWVMDERGRRSPVSVGGGAGIGTYGSGVGLGIGINLSGRDSPRIGTELAVSIRSSTTNQAAWEGRATMTATENSDYADPYAAARRMAEALFEGFPGPSGETFSVE